MECVPNIVCTVIVETENKENDEDSANAEEERNEESYFSY